MPPYYDSIAQGYAELYGAEQLRKVRLILSAITLRATDILLDVGCGNAAYLKLFPCTTIGLDPCRKLLMTSTHPLLVEGVAEALPFRDNSFDWVTSITAVHNFSDVPQGLKEMARVSRARIIISAAQRLPSFRAIEEEVRRRFTVDREIDEGTDIIFFLTKKYK